MLWVKIWGVREGEGEDGGRGEGYEVVGGVGGGKGRVGAVGEAEGLRRGGCEEGG